MAGQTGESSLALQKGELLQPCLAEQSTAAPADWLLVTGWYCSCCCCFLQGSYWGFLCLIACEVMDSNHVFVVGSLTWYDDFVCPDPEGFVCWTSCDAGTEALAVGISKASANAGVTSCVLSGTRSSNIFSHTSCDRVEAGATPEAIEFNPEFSTLIERGQRSERKSHSALFSRRRTPSTRPLLRLVPRAQYPFPICSSAQSRQEYPANSQSIHYGIHHVSLSTITRAAALHGRAACSLRHHNLGFWKIEIYN